jgi:hypothetical protein
MTARPLLAAFALAAGLGAALHARQQPIDPVDFRPFVDGGHWIVRQPLRCRIGVSPHQVAVPVGFVTDFASIPPALQSLIRQEIMAAGVTEPPLVPIAPAFCERGDMPTEEALNKP